MRVGVKVQKIEKKSIWKLKDNSGSEHDKIIVLTESGNGLYNCEWLNLDDTMSGKHVYFSPNELMYKFEKVM